MNANSQKKKTVLLVSDHNNDLTQLHEILKQRYRVAAFDNNSHDFQYVKEQAGEISVAIVCASDAAADDYALFKWLRRDSLTEAIPLLVYCGVEADFAHAGGCLERGAVDIVTPPLREDIIFHRIENAMRLKDSATFHEIEKMLKELPSNIYLKDEKGRYVFATHYWHHIEHTDDPEWSIRGKTDLEIRKDRENAEKAFQTDLEILKTGTGKKYIIEINADGIQEFLEIIKEPVKNDNGKVTGIIALINDVTEKEHMRIRLEQLALKDELTGIRNKQAYLHEMRRLNDNIHEQTANFGFVMIDMNFLKRINDTYGHSRGNEALKRLSKIICSIFKHSPVFRIGGDEFIIVLENQDLENATELCEKLRSALKSNAHAARHAWEKISAAIGIAVYEQNIDKTTTDVFQRADQNMYACKKAMKAMRHD